MEILLGGSKSMTHWVRTAHGAVTFSVPVPNTPSKVVLDPDASVLRR